MADEDFERELSDLLGDSRVDPSAEKAQKLTSAIWDFFGGAPNRQVGDARTVGFTITVEMVDTQGNRWIRHAASDDQGNQLPPWQLKGYLSDAQDWARLLYEKIATELERPSEE